MQMHASNVGRAYVKHSIRDFASRGIAVMRVIDADGVRVLARSCDIRTQQYVRNSGIAMQLTAGARHDE
jgi:hypothetical protein